ncbi:hypothetical protein [Rhodopirellula halodulae]|uniref:hypothetical protein n=1 Tax=Rhodopirellula halodulae TaxID=2894198 RepID=UPI001E455712|nr:hypothetical protein [Rhodopirellula sp. JC737]MCC9658799.1 hypothetical protein [Rhodopirellula sp. JC737]
MAKYKISIRDALSAITIVGPSIGWYVDHKRMANTHKERVEKLNSKIAKYEVVKRHAESAKFGFYSEDVFKALLERVDLRTMVSGVRDVSVFGFEHDGEAQVTFNDGETIIQFVDEDEFNGARKMLAAKRERR